LGLGMDGAPAARALSLSKGGSRSQVSAHGLIGVRRCWVAGASVDGRVDPLTLFRSKAGHGNLLYHTNQVAALPVMRQFSAR
jgi:hypothetical protein